MKWLFIRNIKLISLVFKSIVNMPNCSIAIKNQIENIILKVSKYFSHLITFRKQNKHQNNIH